MINTKSIIVSDIDYDDVYGSPHNPKMFILKEDMVENKLGNIISVSAEPAVSDFAQIVFEKEFQNTIELGSGLLRSQNDRLTALLDAMPIVDFRTRAGVPAGKSLTRKHFVVISIEEILAMANTKNWDLTIHNNKLYMFNGAYWELIALNKVKHFLGRAAEKMGVDEIDARHHTFRDDLYKQFATASFVPPMIRSSNQVLINLQNGTFVITPQSQSLRQFQIKDFLTYQLPFIHDHTATAPIFFNYLDEVLPDKDQQYILAEFAAYVFIKPKTLKLEKSLVLYGSGANGKSVFFEILMALLGRENVSSYSLKSLTEEKGYFRAKLEDKLLNYSSEISANMDLNVFKQLVSGEPVEARLPCKEPFILEDYAKFIFNANDLPKDVEENEAFFRRFIILKFGNYSGTKPGSRIISKNNSE